jgi:branched-chain amino acid transport system substrate-binding protein
MLTIQGGHMQRRTGFLATVAVAAAASVLAASASAAPATQAAAGLSCSKTMKIAFVTPLTGGAGFLGQEQLSWAKYAVKTLPKTLGLKIQLVSGDTPVEQGPAPAQSLAQKFVADKSVIAILGPSTSGAVAASSQTYFEAGMAHVSPSATRTTLTKTSNKEATPAFFRVVPDDGIQGPNDAAFMVTKLKVKKVVVIDFQEPYSQGLAGQVEDYLKSKGVSTIHLSIPNTVTDFSSFVTKVPNDADIVFFPTQKPEDAQTFAQQLIEQGKKAKVFGGDGSNGPGKFKAPGSYVSNFAAPISLFPYNKSIIAGWQKDNGGKEVGSFGPPTYGAVQVILNSIKYACRHSKGTVTRKAVFLDMKRANHIKNWILGGTFQFSTKTNDPLNGKFYIFQIQSNGDYKLIS